MRFEAGVGIDLEIGGRKQWHNNLIWWNQTQLTRPSGSNAGATVEIYSSPIKGTRFVELCWSTFVHLNSRL